MSRLPWCKWYPTDWLASGTRLDMSAAERGVFRDLLDYQYAEGSIPADEVALQRRCAVTTEEFQSTWPAVSKKFIPHPEEAGRLINERAAGVIAESQAISESQVEKGKKGGRPLLRSSGSFSPRSPRRAPVRRRTPREPCSRRPPYSPADTTDPARGDVDALPAR